ncbi:properdin-like isoform X2 [Antedon mediterranea]|uniref:properdin-like isoform X2 n=1 Tax=Antedon mediterranea TaxID=105859 RepID=UPI003AF95000
MRFYSFNLFFVLISTVAASYCFKSYAEKSGGNSRCKQRLTGLGSETSEKDCCQHSSAAGFSKHRKGSRCTPCNRPSPTEISSVWTDWSDWRPCSVTCGNGTQLRYQTCQSHACSGNPVDIRPCNDQDCPVAVDGGWTRWKRWSSCSVSCGKGYQYRVRTCSNPPPLYGGRQCVGKDSIVRSCTVRKSCAVHGGWSLWSSYSQCDKTCGNDGMKVRTRSCTNPAPANGGDDCRGLALDKSPCTDLKACPVDGSWSTWSAWSGCSATCDTGIRIRTRLCNSPRPQHGGKDCPSESRQTRNCTAHVRCPIDGGLTEWSSWSNCGAAQCGAKGHRYRRRHCTNPAPRYGGNPCSNKNAVMKESCIKDCTAVPVKKCRPKVKPTQNAPVSASSSIGELSYPSYEDPASSSTSADEEPSYIDPGFPPMTRMLQKTAQHEKNLRVDPPLPDGFLSYSESSSVSIDIQLSDLSLGKEKPIEKSTNLQQKKPTDTVSFSTSISVSSDASLFQKNDGDVHAEVITPSPPVDEDQPSFSFNEELEDCEEIEEVLEVSSVSESSSADQPSFSSSSN